MYTAIGDLVERGITTIDPYNIIESLNASEATRKYADELSIEKLNELMEMSDVLARHTVEEYKMLVDNVLDAAFRRDTFQRLKECQALCYNRAETNVEEKIYSIIDDVMTEFSTTNDVPMFKDVVDDCWDEIQSRQGDGYAGIQFKFPALNEYATIEPGELFIFAAEAKQGKSMMLLNCAVDLMKKDLAVLYLDSELNTRMFTARILAHIARVEYKRLTSGSYNAEEAQRIDEARKWLKTRKFTHLYIPMFDQQTIFTAVKRVQHTMGLDVLIVDYFKGSGDGDAFDSYQELGRFVDMVKNKICGDTSLATVITNRLDSRYRKRKRTISVEEIQDDIETELMKEQAFEVAKAYVRYRYKHEMKRNGSGIERKILTIVDGVNEEVIQENSNKNPTILSTQRDYIAGEISKDITRNTLLPKDIQHAHDEGIIHFHDSDYFVQRMHNCCLVNLGDMLQNGTVISDTLIEKPHSFSTACNVATQVVAQIASNQYGGQSISLAHLAPFVDVSRRKIRKDVEEEIAACNGDVNSINSIVEKRLKEEIKRGVQTIQYQVLTLMTTNGQTPFITVFMYLGEVEDERTKADLAMIIEEVVRQRYQGVKNEKGAWITPAFPKLIYVLEEDNIREDSEYFYLTKLCAKCSVKRLVPDYISEKMMIQNKIDTNGDGHCFPCMGCRSFLTPYLDENGKPKYYGRFNQGVVTINLPDVGLSAVKRMEGITYVNDEQYQKRKEEIFWEIFEERLELCHKALRLRHERLLGTLSDASPIHWQNGGLARLKKGETIDKLLYGGYSTLSLGYAGLYECVKAMTGKSHTDDDAKPFALAIMQKMNDKCAEWKAAENIDYSLYGTPIESTTYKFAKCLQKRFGVIEGITDRNYITNSYHVHVTEKINAFDKLRFESEFQQLSPGGAISYIETANLSNNVEAAIEVIKYIYDHIMYAELNTKSDFCQECGYDGEIQIVENEDGKLIWECPNCGNRDRAKMNIARRTCGYIGVNDFNQGRTQEIKERYVHLGGE